MDIKKTLKQKIITDILKSNTNSEWSVLVYDNVCAKLLENLFTKSEFINHNIVMSQFIEEKRDKTDFSCVYFVNCDSNTSSIINKDFNNQMYTSYIVCTLKEPENLNKEIKYKKVNVNFIGIEDRIFKCDLLNLYCVADTLSTYLYIEYTNKLIEKECLELETKFKNHDRSGKLIVFDRSVDYYTPILHFYTFQCVLEDFNLINNDFYEKYGDTKIWLDVRYCHLGDIPAVLRSYVQNISSNNSKLNSNVNTKDLMKMVMDAPESYKTNQLLKILFEYTKKCFSKLEYYEIFTDLEQDIVTKINKNSKKTTTSSEEVMKYLKNVNIDKIDRIRIFWLYKLSGNKLDEDDLIKLEKNGFSKENMESDILQGFKPLKYNYKFEYNISRYEPSITIILREYFTKKNKLIRFMKLEEEKSKLKSLRKSSLISVQKKIEKSKICCIYIKGGMTYAEVCAINKLGEELGMEFLIGSDKIYKRDQYIKEMVKSVE